MNENKVILYHGFQASSESETMTKFKKILKKFYPGYKIFSPDLAGHSPNQGFFSKEANLISILEKSHKELSEEFDLTQGNNILCGTSTGFYAVLTWLMEHYNPSNHSISQLIGHKPLIDASHTIDIINQNEELNQLLQEKEYGKNFREFSRIDEINNPYGSSKNPFKIQNIQTLIITGEEDEIVGNADFFRSRISGNNIHYKIVKQGHSQF